MTERILIVERPRPNRQLIGNPQRLDLVFGPVEHHVVHVGRGQPGQCPGVVGIQFDRPLELASGLEIAVLVVFVGVPETPEQVIPRLQAGGGLAQCLVGFVVPNRRVERYDDAAGNLFLHRKHIDQVSVEAFRPYMVASGRLHQLSADANPIARATHAPLQDIADPKGTTDLLGVHHLPLVRERRVAGNYKEPPKLGQRCDQVVGDAIREVLLVTVAGHIVERQHGNGWLLHWSRPWREARSVGHSGWSPLPDA